MTTQQTKVDTARQELLALSRLIRRPPLDNVQLDQAVALRIAAAIDTLHAQPEAPTPSPELTARMEKLEAIVQSLAFYFSGAKRGSVSQFTVCGKLVRDLEDAIAELEPVDGDLIEARKAEADAAEANGFHDYAAKTRAGENDNGPVRIRLEGIKLGRALAEAGK